ncbi:hypothetical protein FOWG_16346 [Fusarium oxysporum f. sp. lycopersici MN25]|nr:hypothetical protein FOWG_16346 [Fusarium oxysporum f. sp. lycopersici MN25]
MVRARGPLKGWYVIQGRGRSTGKPKSAKLRAGGGIDDDTAPDREL